jgi:BirA family transcriptional regulator, biotin operon repressor / biotin---[acetyl-CoA-carboxylase] ligase
MSRTPVDADELRAALGDRWARVQVLEQTGSTNADLLADTGAPDRSVLVSEEQRAGRGRLDRGWTSPPGAGLTFSVLVRPGAPIVTWGWLPLLAGVALREAVTEVAGVDVSVKWPNDLLAAADGRKLAGILAQTSGEAVVIGIGLNVSTSAEELPVETATSLALCGAGEVDRTRLLVAVLNRLDTRLAQWDDVGGDAEACGLAAAYRDACATLRLGVAVTAIDGRRIEGVARDVDSAGRLLVTTLDGGESVIGAGDVEHLRPMS